MSVFRVDKDTKYTGFFYWDYKKKGKMHLDKSPVHRSSGLSLEGTHAGAGRTRREDIDFPVSVLPVNTILHPVFVFSSEPGKRVELRRFPTALLLRVEEKKGAVTCEHVTVKPNEI